MSKVDKVIKRKNAKGIKRLQKEADKINMVKEFTVIQDIAADQVGKCMGYINTIDELITGLKGTDGEKDTDVLLGIKTTLNKERNIILEAIEKFPSIRKKLANPDTHHDGEMDIVDLGDVVTKASKVIGTVIIDFLDFASTHSNPEAGEEWNDIKNKKGDK